MIQEKKIEYMKNAANICGFGINHEGCDLLVELYELILKKEGKTDIDSICKIQAEVKERANIKSRQQALDSVSKIKP